MALDISLDRTNHSGFRTFDVLKLENGQYHFDGKILGKKLPREILKSWQEVEIGPTTSTRLSPCASGKFTFLKKEKKQEHRIEGCTEGKEYGRMIKNLEIIREYAKGL